MNCENCANAIWDPGDNSVGMSSYVEDCRVVINSKIIERVLFNSEDIYCPHFIKQHLLEWELFRCPECNTRHTMYHDYKHDDIQAKFECNECGKIFMSDVPMW